jgi:probable HAF family extracellular repeat protein
MTRLPMPTVPVLGSLLALLILGPAVVMAETYETIDCPDALRTEAQRINDRGDIVGICEDADGAHGFLLRRGVFTLIDHPDGVGPTAAFGINNRGDVAGRWIGADTLHGYLLRRGRFTTIDPPDSTFTVARGIDDAGRIVGFYVDSSGLEARGFLRDARGYRALDFPGATGTAAFGVSVTRIVGGYSDPDTLIHGFVLRNGVYTSIDVPGAVGTRAVGVNVQGDVVGGWSTDPGCPDCFTHAFLRTRRGVLEELAFPGALETVANGINALGQIVGTYVAEDGSLHGFLRDDGNDN